MKVVKWTSLEEAKKNLIEGKYTYDVECAIVSALREGGYCFSGEFHQYGRTGIPVFDDGTYICVSMRSWGELVAKSRNEMSGMDYCSYAWSVDKSIEKLPELDQL